MQNNSAYRQKMNMAIVELLRSVLIYWTEIFHSKHKKCEQQKDGPKAITLSHIYQFFYLLLGFLTIASITVLMELQWKRYCGKK